MSTQIPVELVDSNSNPKDTSFQNNESSIQSQDKSMSDEYNSFIDDIRTVHELQEEECKLIQSNYF